MSSSYMESNLNALSRKTGAHKVTKMWFGNLKLLPKGPININEIKESVGEITSGFLVICGYTQDSWYVKDEMDLHSYFVYKEDLDIYTVDSLDDLYQKYMDYNKNWRVGIRKKKSCYVLNNPVNETYEVYNDPKYPMINYGVAVPLGMSVIKFDNRFDRDLYIRELDSLYSNSSYKAASTISSGLKDGQSIIISDGSYMNDVCCYTYYTITNKSISQGSKVINPSNVNKAVLIAEVMGIQNAIRDAKESGATDIVCYYDNTSVVDIFNSNRTNNVEEIKKFKSFMRHIEKCNISVKFVEIHPKTGKTRNEENKARMYFHNSCDKRCKEMIGLYTKNYTGYCITDTATGVNLSDLVCSQGR